MRPGTFRSATVLAVVAVVVAVACGTDPNGLEPTPPDDAPGASDPDDDESADPGEDISREPREEDDVDGPDDADTDDAAPRPDDDTIISDSREVSMAIADAAERTGVAAGDIEVVESALVTWPDGAIGCPEPGVVYTQALVDGYRIVLDADGTQLTYHGAMGADPFLCQSPADPVQPSQ